MEYRPLEINIIAANDLKVVNLLTKMDVYVVVSISTDPRSKQRTPADKHGHTNPRWNHTLRFTLHEPSLQSNSQTLVFSLYSDRALGDKLIGQVHVPLKQLLEEDTRNLNTKGRIVTHAVRTRSGKTKGSLEFSYKFGEKYTVEMPTPMPMQMPKAVQEPVTAYPVAAAGPSTAGGYYYPPPQQHGAVPYPAQGYNGYPNNAQPGYEYPPNYQNPGYGYQGGYVKPPKKSGGSKLGLGLAGGLLGGLLIGDMISDAGDAYDAGYDDGFGDGFDF